MAKKPVQHTSEIDQLTTDILGEGSNSTYTTSSLPSDKALTIADIRRAVHALDEAEKKRAADLLAWRKKPEYKTGLILVQKIIEWLFAFDDRLDDLALCWTIQQGILEMRPVHISHVKRFEKLAEEYQEWKRNR